MSPLPDIFAPINLSLSNIDFVQITARHQPQMVRYVWHISCKKGGRIDIDPQYRGVQPEKVFRALKTRGVDIREIDTYTQGKKPASANL